MTTVRGSVGIDSNSNCPGGCDPGSAEFQAFTAKLQADVNVVSHAMAFFEHPTDDKHLSV